MTDPKPFCLTCRVNQVKRRKHKYCSHACVPGKVRAVGASKGRRMHTAKRRTARYQLVWERLVLDGKITHSRVLQAFAEIERTAWHNGYRCCELKWQKDTGTKRQQDAA